MHSSPLTPVFTGLRLSLHMLAVALTAVVCGWALVGDDPAAVRVATVVLALVWLVVYLVGVVRPLTRVRRAWWLGGLTVLWVGCLCVSAQAVYLSFVLFFLFLHIAGMRWGTVAVAAITAFGVIGFGLHDGWSVAAVIGPVLGAAVALVISAGYRRLFAEIAERQRLIDELVDTRADLAAQQRAVGQAEERERLAGEIHDTVAQSLSSIHLLLHAAEQRIGADAPAELDVARSAAAEALAETRRLVVALAPVPLDGRSLAGALERITGDVAAHGLGTRFVVDGDPRALPMPIEAALVRVAQGAIGNVVRHSGAWGVQVTLTYTDDGVYLDVVDNGAGFDSADSGFGLETIRRRVSELGGDVEVTSEPGTTIVAVGFTTDDGRSR